MKTPDRGKEMLEQNEKYEQYKQLEREIGDYCKSNPPKEIDLLVGVVHRFMKGTVEFDILQRAFSVYKAIDHDSNAIARMIENCIDNYLSDLKLDPGRN